MARLNNILIVATYAIVAAVLSLALMRLGELQGPLAWTAGVMAFLLIAQVHSAIARSQDNRQSAKVIADLNSFVTGLNRDLVQAEQQIEELTERLETETVQAREALVSEMQVIETLVKNLAEERRPAPARPRAAALREQGGDDALPAPRLVDTMSDKELLDTVRHAIDDNRVDLYLQPIVTLPQRKVKYYEALTRLRGESGEIIMPGDYLPVAGPAGMMPTVDNLLLLRAVQVVRKLNERDANSAVFCNISANSLLDGEFFPRFIDYMEHNKELANQLVFEFSQSTVNGSGPIEIASLQSLARLGFRFSMDQVTDINLDLRNLHDLNFKYVKVAADTLVDQAALGGTDIRPEDIKDLMSRYGMDLIVDQIEQERSVVDVLDFNVDYGQGYLFGNPRLVREEVLANVA